MHWKKRSSQTISCEPGNLVLDPAHGRVDFPMPGTFSLVHINLTKRQSFLNVAFVSNGKALDPIMLVQMVKVVGKDVNSVTTYYDVLGLDKGTLQKTHNSN